MLDPILRAATIYAILLVLFRIVGPRCLAESTPFDIVLLLIISEATQHAMVGNDNSIITAFTVIGTLMGLDLILIHLREKLTFCEKHS